MTNGELLHSLFLCRRIQFSGKFSVCLVKNFHGIWDVMCYYERCRLLQNIISRILIFDDHLEIEPKVDGIKALLKDVGVEVK